MVPELRVRTFTREGGKPVQQQDFSVPASAPPPPPPPKRDPYQQFIDDDTTKRTTSVPLKFLQPAHGSSSSTSGVHPNLTAPRDVTSAPSKARPGHTLADAVLEQQAGLGVTAMDQDATALVWDSPQQRTSRMVLPGVVAPAEGGANGGVSASKGHSTVSGEHNIASEDPSTGGTSASKVHNTASEEHNAAGTAGLVDTQVVRRDRTEVVAGGLGCTVSADDVEGGGATGSLAADLGAGPPQSNLRQHTPGSAVDSCVSGRGAGLQQVAASQRVPGMGVPASSAQGQSRREIFHRQAKLAAQMQRMGMPPLLEWGSSRVKVGKAVAPGLHTNMGTGSDAHFPPHKISSQQVQQRQGNRVQRSRPMSGKLQQQKEEQEQQQEDERRAQHQQAQQARHAQQGQGLADYGNKGSPQAPVHAWRLEWEARKQRAALNGPAVQRARKMKAQMAKERAQREDLSNLAAEYEAAYQGMGRVEGEHFTALDGFSHTLLQSVHPHTPGTPHHKATAPSNEVEGGSRACLKPVGIDMHAWQQAHERLDAYKREQALKQKRNADQRKPAKQDARLERLAKLLAAVQKEGGTLGIDVPRQEPPGEEPERASGVEGSHQELGCRHQQHRDPAHRGDNKPPAGASQELQASRLSSSSSLSLSSSTATRRHPPMQSSVMQKPAKAHSSANNTIHDAADRGSGQPQISQPLRPSSSFSTDQHSPPTLAQHHAHTQQQATQQARVQSTQHALPQHGPATSHRYKEAPQVANKKDHKKGLSVVYYPVKRRPGRGQLRPREHSQHQKQDQQQGAIREKHSQHQKQEQRQGAIREKHGQDQKQDLQQGASRPNNREKTRVEQQHKQGRDHHHRQQQQQQQQHLQGKQREQDSHHRKHKRRMRKEQQQREQQQQEQQQQQQQQHPLPTDLSALPGLCESPGHSSLSSPTAAQLNRFADASDDAVAESSGSGDEWGVSSEDADERGFPKTLQGGSAPRVGLGGSSSMDHHPCSPELWTAQELQSHGSWEAESSTGSWGVERPLHPNCAKHDHEAHDPPIPGPKEAHSLQDLLDQKGPMDPAYEPPQDEDIPQIRFSPAPPWLVQPIAHTPPRYRG